MKTDFELAHPKLCACFHHSIDLTAWATVGAGLGYAYGLLFKAELILTAQLAAIQFVVSYIFEEVNKVVTGNPKKEAKKFYMVQLVGDAVIQAIALLAYRHFNIIGNLGTGVMSLYILAQANSNLEKSTPKPAVIKKEAEEVQKENELEQQEPPKDVQSIESKQPEGPLPVQGQL